MKPRARAGLRGISKTIGNWKLLGNFRKLDYSKARPEAVLQVSYTGNRPVKFPNPPPLRGWKLETQRRKLMSAFTLNEISVDNIFDGPAIIITMSTGQWDALLESAYDSGYILLELNEDQVPVKAYQKQRDIQDRVIEIQSWLNGEYLP
ncbi:MAG: hypothetical protein JXM72_12755 [Deltaproteobacteria bacterium]|nr:hypothetical protein [Deltaproteobacteria bacterium]